MTFPSEAPSLAGVVRPLHSLFMDESGELGTHASSSRHFLICVLKADSEKALRKRLKKQKALLINAGWPKDIEIKGNSIWSAPHDPRIPAEIGKRREEILERIIGSIVAGPIDVFYSIVNKSRIARRLLDADYGIAFNWFSGQLLCKSHKHFGDSDVRLVVDQRNKETHHKLKFDGYVETRLLTDCGHQHGLTIEHRESHDVSGLQAVDFLSWGLFRGYERGDQQFRKIILPHVRVCDDWYAGK